MISGRLSPKLKRKLKLKEPLRKLIYFPVPAPSRRLATKIASLALELKALLNQALYSLLLLVSSSSSK
jgi:hypothetical protein